MPISRERPTRVPDEREALLGWYALQRGIVLLKCEGLDDDQAARVVIPSSPLITVGGILAHLTWVEHLWFQHQMMDRAGTGPGYDDVEGSEFLVAEGRGLDEFVVGYREQCAASDEVIATHDLDAPSLRPSRDGQPPNLRWIVVHMIEETARHAGHLDLIRELIEARPATTEPASRPTRYSPGRDCGSFFEPARYPRADGGGTIGPASPSGASSRSTITGAWSLGSLPLRACRSIQAASTRPVTPALASTRSIRMPRSWWNMPAR